MTGAKEHDTNTDHESGASDGVSDRTQPVDRSDGGTVVTSGNGGRRGASLTHELFEQTQAARALIEQMRDLVGDDDEMIETAVEGETDLHEAIGAAMKRYAELDTLISATAALIASIKDRQDRFKKQQASLKEAVAVAMEGAEIKKLELPIATLSLRRVPPSLDIKDEWLVPERFWKAQDPKLDKRAVLDALKAGEVVPGAALDNGGISLQVRQA